MTASEQCRYCGRPLTKPESIERGYGYDCGVINGDIIIPPDQEISLRRRVEREMARPDIADLIARVRCPQCGAVEGEPCHKQNGEIFRSNVHIARMET